MARAPAQLNPSQRVTSLSIGKILLLTLGVLLLAVGGTWYVLLHTHTGKAVREKIYTAEKSNYPSWMALGVRLEEPKTLPTNHVVPAVAQTPAPKPEPKPEPQRVVMPSKPKPRIERAAWVTVKNPKLDLSPKPAGQYVLPAWTYANCQVENVLVSEIEGYFTVKLTRPIWDATGTLILVPQDQRIGAKALTAELLFGNERIPGFALSYSKPDGTMVELGEAMIMDATGTLGLTGEVDNHWWRLVWTSIFAGGLEGGVQAMQIEVGGESVGAIATGIGREANQGVDRRLGRAQDTRPTITVASGELCQILIPKSQQLPAYAELVRR